MASTPAMTALLDTTYSTYCSDFDSEGEELLIELITSAELGATGAFGPLVLENLEDDAPTHSVAQIPRTAPSAHTSRRSPAVEVEYNESSRSSWTTAHNGAICNNRTARASSEAEALDRRSPLQRFRTAPMKPLSVTDLISPAWCELQYWYTLTKYGRKRATPAMKQGSAIHKVLEEQVHDVVEVTVQTKEDMWGLKLWNTIQGLRTLAATGLTRELEVWGIIEGQVVVGIIDELSHSCPDTSPEHPVVKSDDPPGEAEASTSDEPLSISDSQPAKKAVEPIHSSGSRATPSKKVYLTDVKTRGSDTLPRGVGLRPTHMQLMLYHKLLGGLVSNSVDCGVIFGRYGLKSQNNFSDAFIAQIGALNYPDTVPDEWSLPGSSQDSVTELLSHNSLEQLWVLMIEEFTKAIPSLDTISDVLRAEFRKSKDGSVIGSVAFPYDNNIIDGYIRKEMRWWRGERDAQGVDIEEAFKCRICEFAENCTWRKAKMPDAREKRRLQNLSRKSVV